MVKKVLVVPANKTKLSDESIMLIVDTFGSKRKREKIRKILIHLQQLNLVGEDEGGRILIFDENGQQITGSSSIFEILDYMSQPTYPGRHKDVCEV